MRKPWTLLIRSRVVSPALLVLLFVSARADGQIGARVSNWTVPSSSSSTNSTTPGHARALGDVTNPTPFVGVTPCRIVDTRGPAGPYGAPSLSPGVSRNFALLGGPCAGFPPSVSAYSLNITVTNTLGTGFIKIYPQGGSVPVVSTLNYVAGQTIANAAIVPAGTGSGVTVVAGVAGTDLIIDINGYFPGFLINGTEQFGVIGNFPGSCIICGENTSNALGSSAVLGIETSAAGKTNGVLGANGNTGFQGTFTPGPEGVTGINAFSGVLGMALDRGVVGVLLNTAGVDLAEGWAGKSGPSSSAFYGLEGVVFSTIGSAGSAGVLGTDSSGMPASTFTYFSKSGVIGLSTSHGVQGGSTLVGTGGTLFNSTGGFLAEGDLGYSGSGGPWGVFAFGNVGATGTKPFVEVHPTDPNKLIRYVALEGPEAGTYFRGTAETHDGLAFISVPENFRLVTDAEGMTVQLTPYGAAASMYVVSQDLNQIVVRASRDVKFHYMVNGVRATFKDWQVMVDGGYMPESSTQMLPDSFSAEQKRRLIANGTYNADGTVNMETARRLGWDKIWEARAEAARMGAQASAAQSSDRSNK
jgi:hypothetical protein